jgi:hypothetical protein
VGCGDHGADHTLANYRIFAEHYVKHLRDLPLKALGTAQVQKLLDEKKKTLSPKTWELA